MQMYKGERDKHPGTYDLARGEWTRKACRRMAVCGMSQSHGAVVPICPWRRGPTGRVLHCRNSL